MSTHLISGFLPWDELPENANRARKINAIALVLAIICFAVIPFVKLPPVPRTETKVPEVVARAIERQVVLPPPPPKPPEVKKEEKKETKVEEKKEVKVEKPKPIEKEPVAKAKPTESQVKAAKAVAQQQIASVADALADLRDMDVVATSKPATGGLQKDNGGPAGTSRNMLTSKAGAGSGGVAYTGSASSGFGGGVAGGSGSKGNLNLGSKGTTNMQGKQIAAAGNGTGGEGGKTRGEGGVGKRSQEDIRRIFDQNGGRLNNAYQRALKDDPSMEGTIRLKLVVDPNGKVTSCEVASSDLNNSELEAKIVALVRGFNFGEDDVEVWKGTYPVNFYPN